MQKYRHHFTYIRYNSKGGHKFGCYRYLKLGGYFVKSLCVVVVVIISGFLIFWKTQTLPSILITFDNF